MTRLRAPTARRGWEQHGGIEACAVPMAPLVAPGAYEPEGQLCFVGTLHAGMVPPRGRGAVRTRRDGRGGGLEAALKVVRVVRGTWSYMTSQIEQLGWRGW